MALSGSVAWAVLQYGIRQPHSLVGLGNCNIAVLVRAELRLRAHLAFLFIVFSRNKKAQ